MNLYFGRFVEVCLTFLLVASPLRLSAQPIPASSPPTPLVQPTNELADHLRTLARNPHDLNALIGAGQSALSVGDATAALSFFGRANDVAPTDGRVKAGLGSALLLLERPDDALRLFGEAVALGIPQAKIAADRGLAYDLRGDQASAQRDYRLALRDDQSDELMRRYALSLGIAGQRNEALGLLDPLLRKQDQAAWRDRTFILAMNGDVKGANGITRSVMPQQADAMAPFLKRLGSFTPAQRARAVTYGAMPEDVRTDVAIPTNVIAPTRVAVVTPTPDPRAPLQRFEAEPPPPPSTKIRAGTDAVTDATVEQSAEPDATAPANEARPRRKKSKPLPNPIAEATTRAADAIQPPTLAVPSAALATPAAPKPIIAAAAPPPIVRPAPSAPPPLVVPVPLSSPAPAPPALTLTSTQRPVPPVPAAAPKALPIIVTAQPRFALASIMDDVKPEAISPAAHVPNEAELRAARIAAKKKAADKAKADAEAKAKKAEEDAKRAAERRAPAREWVQVAGGNNRAGFARTWAKLKDGHAALFDGKLAYYTPLNRTYRILVGPFSDADESRDYVNKLHKAGLTGFTFSSDAGQEVSRIGTKGKPNGDSVADTSDAPGTKNASRHHHQGGAGQVPAKHKAHADAGEPQPKRKHHKK